MRLREVGALTVVFGAAVLLAVVTSRHGFWPDEFDDAFSSRSAVAYGFFWGGEQDGSIEPALLRGRGAPTGRKVNLSGQQIETLQEALRSFDVNGPPGPGQTKCSNLRTVVIRLQTARGPLDLAVSKGCAHLVVMRPESSGGMIYMPKQIGAIHELVEEVMPSELAEGELRFERWARRER